MVISNSYTVRLKSSQRKFEIHQGLTTLFALFGLLIGLCRELTNRIIMKANLCFSFYRSRADFEVNDTLGTPKKIKECLDRSLWVFPLPLRWGYMLQCVCTMHAGSCDPFHARTIHSGTCSVGTVYIDRFPQFVVFIKLYNLLFII